MASKHPSITKASLQKPVQSFDGESDDDEDTNVTKRSNVAITKKQSSARDTSRLLVKKVDGRNEPIKFYIVESDVEWGVIVDLRERITECGGELVGDRPEEGYTLVDPRTEEGELEIASRSTQTRRVVSFHFVEESIKRGRPVKFHLHNSLPNDEVDRLRDDILLRGGNPGAELSEAQVVIHSTVFDHRRKWPNLTTPPAPGRKLGAPRTEFTEQDDRCLVAWMAYYFGIKIAGPMGNKAYNRLVQDPNQLWWTSRHPWRSWRERYKMRDARLDPLIIQAVNEREDNKTPEQVERELRLPEFPESEEDDSDQQEDAVQDPAPSTSRVRPKRAKRKAQDTSDIEDEQSDPEGVEQIDRGAKRVKLGTRPEGAPVIKTSASQRARGATRLYTPSSPSREPSPALRYPNRVSPPARVEREESPATTIGEDQGMEDSQSPTQFDNVILDQVVLGGLGGAHRALARYDAELAQFAADKMEAEDDDEGYTIDDPDVDVVGVTQVETPPYIHIDVTEAVESRMESTGESHHDDNAGESGGTVLNTIDEWLSALADAFGAIYSRVEVYYKFAMVNKGMDQAAACEFVERQLKADLRKEKGKDRASG